MANKPTFNDASKWVNELLAINPRLCEQPLALTNLLLAAIYTRLTEMAQQSQPGSNYSRIIASPITTTSSKILARDTGGRVRKVTLWVDSAVGGPTPTIRVSTSGGGGTASGGIRVNAGQANELGEIGPDVELWAVSSTPIDAYLLERA